jgi:hypothetical protein
MSRYVTICSSCLFSCMSVNVQPYVEEEVQGIAPQGAHYSAIDLHQSLFSFLCMLLCISHYCHICSGCLFYCSSVNCQPYNEAEE